MCVGPDGIFSRSAVIVPDMSDPLRPPFLVGLTGGIGSGKTTVANLFADLGVPLIDTDLIAHALTAPGGLAIPAIRDAFGADFIDDEGRMDRAAMRQRAFQDPGSRRLLESILHPLIRTETQREIAMAAERPYAIVVIPLLVEGGGARSWLDRIVVVDCPVDVQIDRVMRRNGIARTQVEAIIAVQADRERRLAAADDVIENGRRDPAELVPLVQALHAQYLCLVTRAHRRPSLEDTKPAR